MTRAEAKLAGLKRYTPLKPCTHGHVADRYVGNNDCIECSAIRAAQYAKDNKQAAIIRASKWRAENLEICRTRERERARANPEENRRKVKEWAAANPDRVKEIAANGYLRNKEAVKAQAKAWAKANPGKRKAIMAANRAVRKMARVPLSAEDKEWLMEIYEQCPPGYEVDHIYPVNGKNSCGLHVPWNLQYLTIEENRNKSNKLPGEFETTLYEFPFAA